MTENLQTRLRASIKHCRDRELRQKVELFLRALHLDNVQAACLEAGKVPRYYYYWWNRFRDAGFKLDALQKKSRRPKRSPRKIPEGVAKKITAYRRDQPHSTEKIRLYLERDYQIRVSRATVYRVLKREGMLKKKRRIPKIPAGALPPKNQRAGTPVPFDTLRASSSPSGRGRRSVPLSPIVPESAAFTPRLLQNRYWLESTLGSGGGGTVYLAQDRRSKNHEVALKILETEKRPDPALIETLKNEFSALSVLQHRHLAQVFDFGISKEEVFFTSEYVAGRNLLEATRSANLNTVFELILQTLRALDFLHGKGVLHLDLKPENILVADPEKSGELCVKLIDFGGAQWKKRGKIFTGEFVGTPPYTPPEVILEQPPSPASDIYSLGILFHQIFAGKLPFQSSDLIEMMKEQVYGEPLKITQLHPALPEDFSNLLLKMVEKDPTRRLQNPQAVVQALNACLDENFTLRGKNAPQHIVSESDYGFRREIHDELIQELSSGRPQTLVLSGPAGVGKSRLLKGVKNALQLTGLHPFPIEDLPKLEEFLKTPRSLSSEPLFIDGIDFGVKDLTTLLDRLENLRLPVVLATRLPASLGLNPSRWISLAELSEKEIRFFFQSEVAEFPSLARSAELHESCRGDLAGLETLLQAMHEESWIQWSEQGWCWMAEPGVQFSALLPAQEERWRQRFQQVEELLKFSSVGMSAITLAGILNLQKEILEEKLVKWENEGRLQSKKVHRVPQYFLQSLESAKLKQGLIHDWVWAQRDLEKLYLSGSFAAGVELANMIFEQSTQNEIPVAVLLACARHYVAAGLSERALQALPANPPQNPGQRGMYYEILSRARFDSGDFAAVQRDLSAALAAYASADDRLGLSRVFNLQASAYKKLSDFDAAEAAYRRSITEAEAGKDPYPQGMAQMNLAILYYERGNFSLAQENYQKAFQLEKLAAQPLLSTKLRDNWVNLLFYTGRSAEAEEACYELLKISLKNGYTQQQAAALSYLALLAGQKNNPELQLHYLQQALGLLKPEQSPLLFFQSLVDRGYVYWNLKKFTAAQIDAEAALGLAARRGNTTSQAIASLLLGKILRDRPRPDLEAASENLNNAHQWIWKNQIRQLLWEVEYDRGLLAKKRGEGLRAKNYFLSSQKHLEDFLQEMPEEFRQNYLRDRKQERIQAELESL